MSMNEEAQFTCPVCKAPFSGDRICGSCGADLTPLMTAIRRSFYLRCQARKALGLGRYREARRFARQAERLHHTSRGRSLLHTAAIAMAVRIDPHL
jgi:hypothetical protein